MAGHELEWARIDTAACEKGIQGGAHGERNPFLEEYPRRYGYGRAIGGALGCIRTCMDHLEKQGRLKNTFTTPFREKPPWKNIDHTLDHPLTADIQEQYGQHGRIEDVQDYITYGRKDNYGTDKQAKGEKDLPNNRLTD